MKYVKMIFIPTLILVLLFSLTSCELSTNKDFDYNSETKNITYNGTEYYLSKYSYGDFYWDDNDVVRISTVIGYIFYGPFEYYGNDHKSPDFIVSVHGYKTRSNFWFAEEDFKYEKQEFIIENTDFKLRASECYFESSYINDYSSNYEKYEVASFKWYLDGTPELYDKISIYNIDDIYYIGGISEKLYKCTPEFIDVLRSEKILDNN